MRQGCSQRKGNCLYEWILLFDYMMHGRKKRFANRPPSLSQRFSCFSFVPWPPFFLLNTLHFVVHERFTIGLPSYNFQMPIQSSFFDMYCVSLTTLQNINKVTLLVKVCRTKFLPTKKCTAKIALCDFVKCMLL